jgi:hypothetical protein
MQMHSFYINYENHKKCDEPWNPWKINFIHKSQIYFNVVDQNASKDEILNLLHNDN